ncbi:hypothetical protein ACIGHF_00840 [Stenotrophomonas sp. NPDC077464]|uniref:hypothetical protein n=1 Tax=unclassified Stenotrophomonas TaxID=196198 RepID=UPI0037D26011
MLLNPTSNQSIPAGHGASPDAAADLVHPAPVPVAPSSGRALLAVLEQQAQQELAALAAAAPSPTPLEPGLAGLAWDLGLSGDRVA